MHCFFPELPIIQTARNYSPDNRTWSISFYPVHSRLISSHDETDLLCSELAFPVSSTIAEDPPKATNIGKLYCRRRQRSPQTLQPGHPGSNGWPWRRWLLECWLDMQSQVAHRKPSRRITFEPLLALTWIEIHRNAKSGCILYRMSIQSAWMA